MTKKTLITARHNLNGKEANPAPGERKNVNSACSHLWRGGPYCKGGLRVDCRTPYIAGIIQGLVSSSQEGSVDSPLRSQRKGENDTLMLSVTYDDDISSALAPGHYLVRVGMTFNARFIGRCGRIENPHIVTAVHREPTSWTFLPVAGDVFYQSDKGGYESVHAWSVIPRVFSGGSPVGVVARVDKGADTLALPYLDAGRVSGAGHLTATLDTGHIFSPLPMAEQSDIRILMPELPTLKTHKSDAVTLKMTYQVNNLPLDRAALAEAGSLVKRSSPSLVLPPIIRLIMPKLRLNTIGLSERSQYSSTNTVLTFDDVNAMRSVTSGKIQSVIDDNDAISAEFWDTDANFSDLKKTVALNIYEQVSGVPDRLRRGIQYYGIGSSCHYKKF